MLPYIVTILGAYLIGCSNMALYLSRWKGVNLRAGGSKNLGASNAFALMGWKAGLLVAVHDIGKAVLAVELSKWIFPDVPLLGFIAGVACVLGHMFPFYLKFKGGKAIATSYGVLLALIPDSFIVLRMAIITAIFSLIIIVKPDSLRVIISMFIFAVSNFFFHDTMSFVIGSLIVSATVILKHLMNYGNEKFKVSLPFHKKHEESEGAAQESKQE